MQKLVGFEKPKIEFLFSQISPSLQNSVEHLILIKEFNILKIFRNNSDVICYDTINKQMLSEFKLHLKFKAVYKHSKNQCIYGIAIDGSVHEMDKFTLNVAMAFIFNRCRE